MGIASPGAPPPIKMPPPSAHPAILGSSASSLSGASAGRAARAAEGMGEDNTVKTSPQGADKPSTAPVTLLGR